MRLKKYQLVYRPGILFGRVGWVQLTAKVGLKGHGSRTLCTSIISCTLLAKQGKLSTAVIMHANMFMCSILVLDDQCPGKLG